MTKTMSISQRCKVGDSYLLHIYYCSKFIVGIVHWLSIRESLIGARPLDLEEKETTKRDRTMMEGKDIEDQKAKPNSVERQIVKVLAVTRPLPKHYHIHYIFLYKKIENIINWHVTYSNTAFNINLTKIT